MERKRAVAYCRVSTEKEDQLNSLDAQRVYFQKYMEKNGYEMVHIYADEGITGTKKRNRKEFLRMLEDAKRHAFDVLFVKDVSRFARNTLDSLENVRMLKGLDIDIVFINNEGILESGSELMFTIMAAMAQEESVNTSKRVKFGKRQNMANGKVPNLVYGYDKVPGELFTLHINQEEAAVVRQIFERYVYQGDGCLAIAKALNSSGLRTKRGCLWSQNAVARIIRNEIYIGRIVNGREATREIYSTKRLKCDKSQWLIHENESLRIISDKLFQSAQNLLESRKEAFHLNGKRQSNRYLFSTLIKCKECGRSFRRIERTYANTYVRWVCSGRNGDGVEACGNAVKIKEEELLSAIRSYLLEWQKDRQAILAQTKKEYERLCLAGRGGRATAEELRREEQKLEKKLSRLKEMFMNDIITMEELKEKSSELNAQMQKVKAGLECVEQEETAGERLKQLLDSLFCDMNEILSSDNITNEMLKQVIDRIEVSNDGNVEVIMKPADKIRIGTTVPICDDHT